MTFSAVAVPSLASAQQNGPIPYIQDRERIRPEDRRPEFRPDDHRHYDRRHDARRDEPRRHHDGRRNRDDDLAIGILGLAAGAIIGGAIVDDRRYEPPPRFRPPVREYHYGFIRPWSPEWYRWCSNRYRSFDPRTGTFIATDGVLQFCDANR
ncbi:BA14K family protein [Rhizobium sp. MHM7A]|nr:BA14K family protein [Rhizobium sp. MHM7A]